MDEDQKRWCPGVRDLTEEHWTYASEFYWRKNHGKSRIDSICKECRKAHTKRWRRNNRDKVKKYDDEYREKNREQIREKNREFYRIMYGKGAHTWKRYRPEYGERLPVGPFRLWLDINVKPHIAKPEEIAELTGIGNGAVNTVLTWSSLARKVDIDPKSMPAYVNGKTKTVPRDLVDRVGLLFGYMNLSDELYVEHGEESP